MIQLPDEIKWLYEQDSISKNFRVSFPNGEYRDLVNADIVSESVVFTESISSNNGLKFGVCEGGHLEFETYFNHNIRNLKIRAQIEIDVTSIVGEPTTYQTEIAYSLSSMPYTAPYTGTYEFTVVNLTPMSMKKYLEAGEEIDLSQLINPDDAAATPVQFSVILYKDVNVEEMDIRLSNDVPYPYYPIIYGYFYVDSCKRNATNNIRKIVAYQNKWDLYGNSEFIKISDDEKAKMRTGLYYASASQAQDYSFGITKFLCSCLNSTAILGDNVEKELLELTPGPRSDNAKTLYTIHVLLPLDEIISVTLVVQCKSFNVMKNPQYQINRTITDVESLYEISYTNSMTEQQIYDEIKQMVIEYMKESRYHHSYGKTDEQLLSEFGYPLEKLYEATFPFFKIFNYTRYYQDHVPEDSEQGSMMSKIINQGADKSFLIYPYMSQFYDIVVDGQSLGSTINIPESMWLQDRPTRPPYDTFPEHTIANLSDIKVHKINIPYDYTISLPRKYERTIDANKSWATPIYSATYVAEDKTLQYLDIKNISDSLVELQGAFLKLDRYTDAFEVVNLYGRKGIYPSPDLYPLDRDPADEALYPQSPQHLITRSLWHSVWYDDRLSNGYDRVCCNWINSDGDPIYKEVIIVDTEDSTYFARDYQSYDISDNYFISTKGLLTEQQVDDILTELARILKNIQYYVADIEMRGLPFLEAGDSVSVITKDGGFTTFALRHRLSGIQALTDSIEAR